MMVLLGQHRRFEVRQTLLYSLSHRNLNFHHQVLDFCYHLHRMQKTDGKDEIVTGIVCFLFHVVFLFSNNIILHSYSAFVFDGRTNSSTSAN